ncbi:alpha/beta hydrolase [Candidatus Riflebacteria bacterium]
MFFQELKGSLLSLPFESECLKNNFYNDPDKRNLIVYLPPGYEDGKEEYPLFMFLPAFWGTGLKMLNWEPFFENLPLRIDRLICKKKMGPIICFFPDCFTALGGNQYVDSETLGPYSQYLNEELIPFALDNFRVRQNPESRVLFGNSSGGYGALFQAFTRPESFGAILCSSGDMNFDSLLRRDFPTVVDILAKYERSPKKFLEQFYKKSCKDGTDILVLFHFAVAASFDPRPDLELGFEYPVDLYTGEIDEKVYSRWLEYDPIHLVKKYAENLKSLKGLFIECGNRDEHFLHHGSRILHRHLEELKIIHHYEEFDAGHRGTAFRYDITLPWLYEKVSP